MWTAWTAWTVPRHTERMWPRGAQRSRVQVLRWMLLWCSSMTSAAVETAAAAMETTGCGMGTRTGAYPAPGRICVRDAAMIEAAERAGMFSGECAACAHRRVTGRSCVTKTSIAAKTSIVIDEGRAVGDVPVVVVIQLVMVPVSSPMVPTPTKAAENSDADSDAEENSRPDEHVRTSDPTRIERERVSVDIPRIVFRHINDVGISGRNRDSLPLARHILLRRGLQVSCLLRALTHYLNCIEDFLRLVYIGLSQRRGPGEVLVQHRKHRRKLRDGLHTGIPGLRIRRSGQFRSLETRVLLQPPICFHHFGGIACGGNDLRNQRVRVQRDRRHQLVQLVRRPCG